VFEGQEERGDKLSARIGTVREVTGGESRNNEKKGKRNMVGKRRTTKGKRLFKKVFDEGGGSRTTRNFLGGAPCSTQEPLLSKVS